MELTSFYRSKPITPADAAGRIASGATLSKGMTIKFAGQDEELSMEEAARVMGLSVAAVKGRVFHGRKKLHQVLKRESVWIHGKQVLGAGRRVNGLSRRQLAYGSCD